MYMLLNTQVNVALDYRINDAKTDDILWSYHQNMIYNSNQGGGGGGGLGGLIAQLIVEAIHAAITKGVPNYLPLANQANTLALLSYPGNGIPPGPYATEQKELLPRTDK